MKAIKDFNLDNNGKKLITQCLMYYKGNVKEAAKSLGVTRATLYKKLEKYGLNIEKYRDK